jgi:predicted Zn finger-like uncharacterized protein
MPSSFACPECSAVLKTKADIPAGKKVKCPRCATIFAAPEPEEEPVRTVSSRGTHANGTSVRSGKPPAVASTRRPVPPAEDADDEEMRPRKRSKKRKKKKQNNNMALLVGLGGGGVLLLVLVLFLGFVSPGFFKSTERARGGKKNVEPVAAVPDPLNFIAPEFNLFFGFDLQQWPEALAEGLNDPKAQVPEALKEFANLTEKVVAAVNTSQGEVVVILRTKQACDPQQIMNLVKNTDAPEQVGGKTIYRIKNALAALGALASRHNPNGGPGNSLNQGVVFLHIPNDRIIMLAACPPQHEDKLLAFTGETPAISDQAAKEVRAVESSYFWAAVEITPQINQVLTKIDPKALDQAPELQAAVGPLQGSKGAAFAVDLSQGDKVGIRASVTCGSTSDALQMRAAVQEFVDKKVKSFVEMAKMFIPAEAAPTLNPLLTESVSSLAVKAEGAQVFLTLEFSKQSLQNLQNFARSQGGQLPQWGMPGRAAPPSHGPEGKPGSLEGATFQGQETLAGYGALRFEFLANGQAIMHDRDGRSSGQWQSTGDQVTLTFHGNVVYKGTLNGRTLSGTATNSETQWTWDGTVYWPPDMPPPMPPPQIQQRPGPAPGPPGLRPPGGKRPGGRPPQLGGPPVR